MRIIKDIRILLVDGQEVVRRGVRDTLGVEEDMEIVGDYSSAEEALSQTEILLPNIVLMEAKMPGMGGVEATRRLHQKRTPCKVIMLTLHEDCLAEALEAGVAGYLLKDIRCQELAEAIRRVYHGELVIDERLISTYHIVEGEAEYLPLVGNGILVKEVELVIPPPVDASWLLRFICHVEEAIEASIVQQVGSLVGGTAITILLRRALSLADVLGRLREMPDVEEAREKSASEYSSFDFANKTIARLGTHPKKKLLVTLKEAGSAKQLELTGLRAG